MESEEARKIRDCEALKQIIAQWNANRLDLFTLSEPNQDLEFHGVMRFYFQDSGQKIATKCVRVSSTASTQAVVETLIEKFRPDMKMLYVPEYALYEIHPNGEERRLSPDEKPLLVQLNWHKDDREGRFLLRRMDEKSTLPALQPPEESSFRRKLSKREKRQVKKQERLRRMRSGSGTHDENDVSVAEKLYTELPETSFTRSISNPEAVMRRRRQQKLEKKLQAFRSKDGGPDTGGTLKIYGESLCKDVPYKTLLLSVRDNAAFVVREMLDKYGLLREDPQNYCLVQVMATNGSESPDKFSGDREDILDDDECPLSILMNHPPSQGPLMFHVRRRPAEHASRRRKKKPGTGTGSGTSSRNGMENESNIDSAERLPYLLELNLDGSEVRQTQAQRYLLQPNVTEVGSDRSMQGQSLTLFGADVQARHCVIAHTEGIVTLTPCSRQADTYVNGQRIYETTILHHGSVVRFGRSHNFRFVDPNQEERVRTRYDSGSVSNRPTDLALERWKRISLQTNQLQGTGRRTPKPRPYSEYNLRSANYERQVARGTDPILPAVLELPEETEDGFLHALIPGLDTRGTQFKLAPTYAIYLAARHRASTHFRPELTPLERAHRLTLLLGRVGAMIQAVVQERYSDPSSLAFWMANASELLHFLKCDRHICAFSLDGQDLLAEAVEQAFRSLSNALQAELLQATPAMVSEKEEGPDDEAATAPVLSVLTSCMGLLRRCRLNAALTIQLFSQLFHSLNAHIFNRLLGVERVGGVHLGIGGGPNVNMCSRAWGARLGRRLHRLELWAERQGLELAADCHLARLVQATHLLQAPKANGDELSAVVSACFKLNSLQLRAILERYRPASDEPPIPQHLVDAVVRVAESTADELALADGREIRLEEDTYLAVPFLLPDDGYSCDVMRGLPPGLTETLAPLQHAGLCRLTPQPTSSGFWTIYMGEAALSPQPQMRSPSAMSGRAPPTEPEVKVLQLRKTSESMGLSIVAARGTGQDRLGIYIKSVVKGGSADMDGRLQAGDQLLSVDGQSLIGITQDKAAEIMMRTGPVVCLEVAKQGAMFHGLATLLQQPSPTSSRASLPKSRPKSEDVSSLASPHMDTDRRGYQERLVDWDRPPKENHPPITHPHPAPLDDTSASFSNPNLNVDHPGYPGYGSRRMSERDVLPMNRMQNSKSVPALNSEIPTGPMPLGDRVSPGGSAGSGSATLGPPQQRALSSQYLAPGQQSRPVVPNTQNPHYDPPTVSNHGLHSFGSQQTLPIVPNVAHSRSRSVQNLTDGRGGSLRGRNPSGPEEDRQYQNVVVYPSSQPEAGPYGEDKAMRQPRMMQPLYQGQPNNMAPPMQARASSMQQAPMRGPMPAPGPYNPQQQPVRPPGSLQHQTYSPRPPPPGNASMNTPEKQFNRHLMAGSESMTSDSPPPPPPPTSTHPLYSARPVTTASSQADLRQSRELLRAMPVQLSATNPWDREEKEMEQKRRKEVVRQWMDDQIAELETMPNRNPRQEEQLRTLRLEREFQRRAEEMASHGEDEEENEEEEGVTDPRGMMRLVQEDMERARKWRMEREQQTLAKMPNVPSQTQMPVATQQPMQHMHTQQQQEIRSSNGTMTMTQSYITQSKPVMNPNQSVQHDEDRQRKIDAFHQKQRELEATQQAEERILREAQRRKEEEVRASQQSSFSYGSGPNQRLDSLVKRESSVPQGDYGGQHTYQPPAPPPPAHVTSPPPQPPPASKRVSFHDQPKTQMGRTQIGYDANANQEKVIEDPDVFINEAEHLLSTPKNDTVLLTGSTPGVIGAQEVYKDPRLRRLAEQEQQQKSSNRPGGPEKMSFKEKMKMFALESGEAGSPKDKVTISRAQREIDNRRQLVNAETLNQ